MAVVVVDGGAVEGPAWMARVARCLQWVVKPAWVLLRGCKRVDFWIQRAGKEGNGRELGGHGILVGHRNDQSEGALRAPFSISVVRAGRGTTWSFVPRQPIQ